jgi:hypothetical protein
VGSFIDLTGQRFGRLVVVRRVEDNRHRQAQWLCTCDCGNTITCVGYRLRTSDTKSCGCFKHDRSASIGRARTIPLDGGIFGRWTVIERAGSSPGKGGLALWRVRCECGNERNIQGVALRGGRSRSCGCLSREITSARLRTKPNPPPHPRPDMKPWEVEGISRSAWYGRRQRERRRERQPDAR